MITSTSLLIQSAGLSEKDAARVLKTDRATIRKWLSGEVETPDGATKELWSIIDLQQRAANYVLTLVNRFQPDGEIRLCVSDNEYMSQIQGWPAAATMNGAVRHFLEMADDATRARTRVIYCLEPPGADTYTFGVRLRPDGSFAEVDDPPETDG